MISVVKELSNFLRHSNGTQLSLRLISVVTELLYFILTQLKVVVLTTRDLFHYLKHSNQTHLSLNFGSGVTEVLLDFFRSHSIQITVLVLKEQSNYVKHSNSIHPSLHSISIVTSFKPFVLTQYR
jgi:hypothetical protein